MKYKARKGVILTSICDQYLLIAAKEARVDCPYVSEINETFADCWKLLEKGTDQEQIVQELMKEYETDNAAQLKKDVDQMIQLLLEQGYIIGKEE